MTSLHRRRFLQLGTAAMTVALAGCFGSDEEPSYAQWIPKTDEQIRTAYIDFTVTTESPNAEQVLPLILPSDEGGNPTELLTQVTGLDDVDDPLLTWPISVGGRILGTATIGIAASGLGYLVDPEQPQLGIDELLVANDVIVGVGEIDLARADEKLQSGSSGLIGDISFEKVGGIDEFTLYEPSSGDQGGITAVSETTVLVAETREEVRTVVETSRGNRARAVDETNPFQWLTETVGRGHIVAGWTGPIDLEEFFFGDPDERPASDLVRMEDDVLSSVKFSAEEEHITTDFALQRPDMDEQTQTRLESEFGTAAAEHSVTFEDGRMTTSGTYENDVLDVEFTQPKGTAETEAGDDSIETVDPPQKVADAVPDGAFEFTYEADMERVKVEVVEEFEADTITITTVESDFEFETSDPGKINYVYAYIDGDGDQVVVTITVDGESGVVARKEFP